MVEPKRRGVQAQPVDARLAPPIPSVSGNGASEVAHVQPDLGSPPRVNLDPDEGVDWAFLLHLPVGNCLLAAPLPLLNQPDPLVSGLLYP